MSRMGNIAQQDTNIDIIFVNDKLVQKMNYEQLDDTWGSDHFPIVTELEVKRTRYKKQTNRISTKRTNWQDYEKEMEEQEQSLETDEYIKLDNKGKYKFIMRQMKRAVEIATYGKKEMRRREECQKEIRNKKENSRKQTKMKGNPVSWWDLECEEIIKDRKNQLVKYRTTKKVEDFIEFKRLKAVARKVI